MELRSAIRSFISSNLVLLGEDEIQFEDSDNIFQLGFVNSLFAIKLLNFVEHKFDITVDNEDINIDNFSSVDKITMLVSKKINQPV